MLLKGYVCEGERGEEIPSGRLEGSMLQLQQGEERGEGINLEKELGEDTLISRGCGVQE